MTEIIGKTGTVTFAQFKVEETFISNSTLHWKIKDENGSVKEADESISYKQIGPGLFFISWIEKDGLTVSQVLDVTKRTAVAFVSRADENSDRGQRSSNFLEGTFELS